MLERLLGLDREITLALNGSDSLYADGLMMLITQTLTWVPAGLVMLYVVFRNSDTVRFVSTVAALVLCFLLANGLSELCKECFGRLRPVNNPDLRGLVSVVDGYRPDSFSFFSAHAANTMSVAVFLSFIFRNRRLNVLMILWSLLNGWSRVYLGVHYFGDVVVGFAVGLLAGILVRHVHRIVSLGILGRGQPAFFPPRDIERVSLALASTFAVIAIVANVYCL